MARYVVVGPERTYVDWVTDDGGPSYPEHDVYLVDAPTRRAAKWAAFNRAKERGDKWWRELYDEHPLKGVTVEDADDIETPDAWPGLYVAAAVSYLEKGTPSGES